MSNGDDRIADSADDAAFVQRSHELLQDSAEQIDARIRSRLTQARFAAVDAARQSQGRFPVWSRWVPTASLAGVAALAVMLWSGQESSIPQTAPLIEAQAVQHSSMEDLDIVVAEENLEMIEDLEFYEWLDSEPGAAAASVTG